MLGKIQFPMAGEDMKVKGKSQNLRFIMMWLGEICESRREK